MYAKTNEDQTTSRKAPQDGFASLGHMLGKFAADYEVRFNGYFIDVFYLAIK